MKKVWQKPTLEVLDIEKTMCGPGLRWDDAEKCDPDEHCHYS